MFIRVETTSGMPITRQIMDQIRAHVVANELSTGDRLPSVRELARQLAVNQNTILRVYERLTSEGLLERRHGNGTFVAAGPSEQQRKKERKDLCEQLKVLLERAAAVGVERPRLERLIDQAFSSATKPGKPSRRRRS